MSGRSDGNIRFAELCMLLGRLQFQERVRGGHHIFFREGIEEIINLQSQSGGRAKPYQVKQIRGLILRYNLRLESER